MPIKTTPGQNRFYYKEAEPDTKYPGVTRIVDMLPKPFLQRWYANMSAELAIDSLDFIAAMAERDREGAKKYLAGAAPRYTSARSKIGSQAHDLFERQIRREPIGRVHPDLEPYRRGFADFLERVRPELVRAEDVAWSDTYRYAGSFDAWLRLRVVTNADGTWTMDPANASGAAVWVNVIADWKTSKSVWPSVALQMAAYASADKLIDPSGAEERMPTFSGAVVLHITPEGWTLHPVYAPQLAEAFSHFVYLRQTFDWEQSCSRKALGAPLAASRVATGTQRRA
ncbi:hypothetical protein DT019_08620 [Streptomyces sp. SDr-06]|uniref:hypothetical protein n=1 Tax=Streptomyces sp. SDr-06 TaxID=2267702 RepID=UPI000DEA6282|nr:hypothetical protein [Streptomyces sp. SDr-06]RCH68728.1 hypothetical protein DT019_08620 [Streptomyces sp. SDr-06]